MDTNEHERRRREKRTAAPKFSGVKSTRIDFRPLSWFCYLLSASIRVHFTPEHFGAAVGFIRLFSRRRTLYLSVMATIAEIERLALNLPESQRAILAAHLLGSLPSVLHDEDEGIAEALRRDAEFEADPSMGVSLEELDQQVRRRRS